MNSSSLVVVLTVAFVASAQAQSRSTPQAANTIPTTPVSLGTPPSPQDAPLPDLDTLPVTAQPADSSVKRALDRLKPNCADVVYHSCWSSSATDTPDPAEIAMREAARNREAGEIYYHDKNYKGAESRFREALDYQPGDAMSRFALAQSLEKLGRKAEARSEYQGYLSILPDGRSAARAKKALQRLSPAS